MTTLALLTAILLHLTLLHPTSADVIPLPSLPHGTCTTSYRPIPNSCPALGVWHDKYEPRYNICGRNGCVVYQPPGDLLPAYACRGSPLCENPLFMDPRVCEPYVTCKCDDGWKMIAGECVQKVCYYDGEINGRGPEFAEGERWEWGVAMGRESNPVRLHLLNVKLQRPTIILLRKPHQVLRLPPDKHPILHKEVPVLCTLAFLDPRLPRTSFLVTREDHTPEGFDAIQRRVDTLKVIGGETVLLNQEAHYLMAFVTVDDDTRGDGFISAVDPGADTVLTADLLDDGFGDEVEGVEARDEGCWMSQPPTVLVVTASGLEFVYLL
ncbi:hypothetical protein B0T16DRAFT_389389 [Cercophora newfieldiana]|uniref:Uncharacterized protein n=1 Tax=Cercophora newfieldiana TaxID=92897 RepID=A0AA39YE44_9PEZI|nr:hypothetical protein B0T16DRAFT_389389 [Cercophora newfieldiana]